MLTARVYDVAVRFPGPCQVATHAVAAGQNIIFSYDVAEGNSFGAGTTVEQEA